VSIEIRLPELGEGIESAEVVAVRVAPGDRVAADQPLLEIESEKAAVEVPSPAAGTVVELRVAPGDSVTPGQVIALLEPAEGAQAGPTAAEAPPSGAVPEPEPGAGEAAPAPPRGEAAPAPEPPAPPAPAAAESQASPGPVRPVPASPRVRRIARELGVDLAGVRGSGPRGRITEEDVKAAVRRALAAGTSGAAAGPLPDLARWGEVEREPMGTVRRLTAEHMARSWAEIPHVTHNDRADITDLEAARRRLAPEVEAAGGRLTLTAILVRLAAAALRRFPRFNAAVDMERHEVVRRRHVHIGVAVDTPRGLLVPVIRDADRKGIAAIAAELADLAARARERRLEPSEMQGAGFTISNLGGIGGTGFTPVVPWPQVAILGVSRAAMQPVWNGETFVPRLMLPLALSYDHRLIDGADAARFLRFLCEALESPLRALL